MSNTPPALALSAFAALLTDKKKPRMLAIVQVANIRGSV